MVWILRKYARQRKFLIKLLWDCFSFAWSFILPNNQTATVYCKGMEIWSVKTTHLAGHSAL